ncbi:MAG TPA: MogA/MoaB family molybdenum cofactor biosynthesis protein [Phycisphaerales bacterium]|nr:MogA/MoaB family molybdenum cofactor biosynthesis protein [Phycisphaerales bacterium]
MTPSAPIRAAVLTVSDRCSRGERADTSGPALCDLLRSRLSAEIIHTAILPDEPDQLEAYFRAWSEPALPAVRTDLILSTGGTGLAPRDITPEAAAKVIQRPHPALMELARFRCLTKTPKTYLSRGVAGTINQTLLITLPGSPRGATEMLEALLDILPHAIETLRGDVKDG